MIIGSEELRVDTVGRKPSGGEAKTRDRKGDSRKDGVPLCKVT